jgi:uncharacterized lipoprotein YehR (DUF1307 family)
MDRNNIWQIVMAVFLPLVLTAQTENWVFTYNGSANSWDYANSIVYGADGNIYAAGSSPGSGTYEDFTVVSLTAAGDTNWVYRYNGPDNGGDYANSIIYSADSNIYAAGTSLGSGTGSDFTVISLTTAGDTNWVYRYNGPANSVDFVHSIVYGADGNIYVAGSSTGSGTYDDFTVISLTAAGDTNWVYRYNGPANSYDYAVSIVYGADSNIYVAGSSTGNGTSDDFTVISLTPDLSVQEERKMIVMKNPYGATIFSGPLLFPKGINCKVFDITGRVVMPDKIKQGIYFIEVDGKITQKVVKVR